jgi:hypothetical protein
MPNEHFLRVEVNRCDQSIGLTSIEYVLAFDVINLLKRFAQIVEIRKLGFRNNAVPTRERRLSVGMNFPKIDESRSLYDMHG